MIRAGDITLINNLPYNCIKIEGETAYLKLVGEERRGRFRKMDAKMVPYLDENKNLIVPKAKPFSRRRMLSFKFMDIVKEEVELGVSHDLPYAIAEWLDSIIRELATKAEINAHTQRKKVIDASHWYWLEMSPTQGIGHWPENREYANDHKKWLMEQDNEIKFEEE